MSNTGHKCISATFDTDGEILRYQVTVQWKGEKRKATIRGGSLEEALETRRSFELELDKPRTERHIRSNQTGVYLTEDGHGKKSWVAQFGTVRKHFSVKKYGKSARFLAGRKRQEMVTTAARLESRRNPFPASKPTSEGGA